MVFLTYRHRLYPNERQQRKMNGWLKSLRLLYNSSLAERRDAYRSEGRSVSVYQQVSALPALKRVHPRYADIHSQVLQNALMRLEGSFRRFFKGSGYPRFKGADRYRSFTYPQNTGFHVQEDGKKIKLSRMGNVRMRRHRKIEGLPKTATVIRYPSGKWYVLICCELPDAQVEEGQPMTGFDLGLTNYLTSSGGAVTKPLRALKNAEKALRREQRRLSRKKRGSENRRKQKRRVAKTHEKVSNRRKDFLHKTSRNIVDSHEGFAFEKLRVQSMLKNHNLAKAIADAGWTMFVHMTAYKAEKAGKPFALVRSAGTSQECSGCGTVVAKDLAERVHRCLRCGLTADRDYNAAINIQRRAGTARNHACGEVISTDGASHSQVASSKQEALT